MKSPITVRLVPEEAGWAILAEADGESRRLRLYRPGFTPREPDFFDGAALATLPLALRSGRSLHVAGPLTRTLLRNLHEQVEGWSNWRSDIFSEVAITCDAIVDYPYPAEGELLAAWSGGLRSTFALAGQEPASRVAEHSITAALHVLGTSPRGPNPTQAESLARRLGDAGLDAILVTSNALEAGFIDPIIGPLPVIASAAHLFAGTSTRMAIHADTIPFKIQTIRPRSSPTLGDFYTGNRLAIHRVGGTVSAPAMLRAIIDTPFEGLLEGCRDTGFTAPRCGRCHDCQVLALAEKAAGLAPHDKSTSEKTAPAAPDIMELENLLAISDWAGRRADKLGLQMSLARKQLARARLERQTWIQAKAGKVAPWPR